MIKLSEKEFHINQNYIFQLCDKMSTKYLFMKKEAKKLKIGLKLPDEMISQIRWQSFRNGFDNLAK